MRLGADVASNCIDMLGRIRAGRPWRFRLVSLTLTEQEAVQDRHDIVLLRKRATGRHCLSHCSTSQSVVLLDRQTDGIGVELSCPTSDAELNLVEVEFSNADVHHVPDAVLENDVRDARM